MKERRQKVEVRCDQPQQGEKRKRVSRHLSGVPLAAGSGAKEEKQVKGRAERQVEGNGEQKKKKKKRNFFPFKALEQSALRVRNVEKRDLVKKNTGEGSRGGKKKAEKGGRPSPQD